MNERRIGILGGGPSGLFMLKRLIESGQDQFTLDIFERKQTLGPGMPYSEEGASVEHITNVSSNEIPEIMYDFETWLKKLPKSVLERYHIDLHTFNEYKVLPRLLFGQYLSAQFSAYLKIAKERKIICNVHLSTEIVDVKQDVKSDEVVVVDHRSKSYCLDTVIICTGHVWAKKREGSVPGYFDSPYPPSKIAQAYNHPVAIRGASLTAIDAIRTIARNNGAFVVNEAGELKYQLNSNSANLKIVMHSKNGKLPAVRFHLEDTHLKQTAVLTEEEIKDHIQKNGGFLSLDFVFERNFKEILRNKQPKFYQVIKHFTVEEFVDKVMNLRDQLDPFVLLKAEYLEAEKSIRREESIFWKELLGVLSFEMNYPAKYFSAEDMLRLKKVLMPLITVIISFAPQSSVKELLLLHKLGILELVAVGDESEVQINENNEIIYHYKHEKEVATSQKFHVFVDCVGQAQMSIEDFPFQSLIRSEAISPARIKFRNAENAGLLADDADIYMAEDGKVYLNVSGIAVNDHFQIVDKYNCYNNQIYMMAVPFMGGFNPDYSGLDFCEAVSQKICRRIFSVND